MLSFLVGNSTESPLVAVSLAALFQIFLIVFSKFTDGSGLSLPITSFFGSFLSSVVDTFAVLNLTSFFLSAILDTSPASIVSVVDTFAVLNLTSFFLSAILDTSPASIVSCISSVGLCDSTPDIAKGVSVSYPSASFHPFAKYSFSLVLSITIVLPCLETIVSFLGSLSCLGNSSSISLPLGSFSLTL